MITKSAKRALLKIAGLLDKGNPQSQHYKPFLEAELAAYNYKPLIAAEKYETTILLANENGFIHDAALANERYGQYLLSQCDEHIIHNLKGSQAIGKDSSSSIQGSAKDSIQANNQLRLQDRKLHEAIVQLEESIRCYHEWGGHAKAKFLEDRYTKLFGRQYISRPATLP